MSIGSENRWHFEQSIIEQTRCRVETFDCTGVGLGWEVPPELRSRVRLHLACVGAPEWRYKDLPGGGKGRLLPRAGEKYEVISWADMLDRIGLRNRAPAFAKIDCEGCERDLFRELLASGQHLRLPDQMSVELHYPYDRNNRSVWNRRFKDLAAYPVEAMVKEMHAVAGFTLIGHVPAGIDCCREVLFARTRCPMRAEVKRPTAPLVSPPIVVPCAWSHTEGILKASMMRVEDALLSDWIVGYKRSMPCEPRLHVISGDLARARPAFQSVRNVSFHANDFPSDIARASAYHQMQWHIMWADNFTTAAHLLFWDVDSIPIMPLRCHNYFDASTGRPHWYYWSARPKSWLEPIQQMFERAAQRGVRFVAPPTSMPRNMDFMTFFPVVIPRAAFSLARRVVVMGSLACSAEGTGCTFDQAWTNSTRPSHVDILGKAILLLQPEMVHVISCPKDAARASQEANACVDTYRDVEHVKHPLQTAHTRPRHFLDEREAHKYALEMLAAGEQWQQGGKTVLPPQLFHYRRPRKEGVLDMIAKQRYGGVERCA